MCILLERPEIFLVLLNLLQQILLDRKKLIESKLYSLVVGLATVCNWAVDIIETGHFQMGQDLRGEACHAGCAVPVHFDCVVELGFVIAFLKGSVYVRFSNGCLCRRRGSIPWSES